MMPSRKSQGLDCAEAPQRDVAISGLLLAMRGGGTAWLGCSGWHPLYWHYITACWAVGTLQGTRYYTELTVKLNCQEQRVDTAVDEIEWAAWLFRRCQWRSVT